jgi:hypothetical protein
MNRQRLAAALLLAVSLTACASVEFRRSTETSGTFVSTGTAMTIFSIDLPKSALQIARENASDAGLANMSVDSVTVTPDWGWWNWVLDIVSVRRAVVRGTWGFDGDR